MKVYVLTNTNDTFESVLFGVYSSPSRAIEAADRDPMLRVPKEAWSARVCHGERPPVTEWKAEVMHGFNFNPQQWLILEVQVDA